MVDVILDERNKNGLFLHLQDFIERTNITKELLTHIADPFPSNVKK